MKKLYLPLLLCFTLLLTACGGASARGEVEKISASLNELYGLNFTARIRAEYDDRSAEFTLDYTEDADGCRVTVTSPEIIKGVSAHISTGETALEYDGVALDTGMLDDFGLSPLSALPILVDAMRGAYIDSAWEEGEELVAVFIPSDELSAEVHFDKYTKLPVSAELASGGRVRVFAEISGWNQLNR